MHFPSCKQAGLQAEHWRPHLGSPRCAADMQVVKAGEEREVTM